MINSSQDLLSQIVVYNKYARKDLSRRETWDEIIDRYVARCYEEILWRRDVEKQFKSKSITVEKGSLAEQIIVNSKYIYDKKILPSMRALQFSVLQKRITVEYIIVATPRWMTTVHLVK